jgi:hypothetical protein
MTETKEEREDREEREAWASIPFIDKVKIAVILTYFISMSYLEMLINKVSPPKKPEPQPTNYRKPIGYQQKKHIRGEP